MPIVTRKRQLSFPNYAQIRKGMPKTDDGYVGKDLNDKFRIQFSPDFDDVQADWQKIFGEFFPKVLPVYLPFDDVDQVWDCWYEAYTGGRMVCRADGERFIYWVDTKTGERIVVNGEPYIAFDPDMVVGTYLNRKTNKEVPIKARMVGRLTVIPGFEFPHYGCLTLHTTSIYDVLNISSQLDGLMSLTGGRLKMIPINLVRRQREITWNKPDGTAQRITKGIVNLEVDSNWIKAQLEMMRQQALPKYDPKFLLPESTLSLGSQEINEEHGEEDPNYEPNAEAPVEPIPTLSNPAQEGRSEVLEGTVVENDGSPVETPQNASGEPEPGGQYRLPEETERPFSADYSRQRLWDFVEKAERTVNPPADNPRYRSEIVASLNQYIGEEDRHALIYWLSFWKTQSTTELSPAVILGMHKWLKPAYDKATKKWVLDPMGWQEIVACAKEAVQVLADEEGHSPSEEELED